MDIRQFEDKHLAHYSYAILSDQKIILIDPARNPQPYYDYANEQHATIIGVIETHPHADFISSHLEIHETTGAIIYAHSLTQADYPHQRFDDGDCIPLGEINLKSIHTPGHSPDSISIVLEYDNKDKAVFTGDTLFIGDCGRPDLREGTGNLNAKREILAKQMYHSLREKLMRLEDDVMVYPAHGAGTLCGKALSDANSSTIGKEKATNWSLRDMTEDTFVSELIADQPFIPKYFAYNVELNKQGAPAFKTSVDKVKIINNVKTSSLNPNLIIIDARPENEFKAAHLPNSFNIQLGNKFETWLGSIVSPQEKFYLTSNNIQDLNALMQRTASIGYEQYIEAAIVNSSGEQATKTLDLIHFTNNTGDYTIVDVRNASETKDNAIFPHAINIPLGELRENAKSIPTNKPVVVHCAGGYRSAAGSSIVNRALGGATEVYDLGESVKDFT